MGPRRHDRWTLRSGPLGLASAVSLALVLNPTASPLAAQPAPDSASVHRTARALQTSFERARLRNLPLGSSGGGEGGRCDEIIGRLCVWDGGDDGWTPEPEPPEIIERREGLLRALDSLAVESPRDGWILGQRIRYRIEAGASGEAAEVARACGLAEPWLCDAYLGLALHQDLDIPGAEAAFDRALRGMPASMRDAWTNPEPLLHGDLDDWLERQTDSAAAVARLWRFADPLYLVPGNDRWTGHLSRWAWAFSSEGTRSPHQLSWGEDLTESVVRFGWPVAWEQPWPRAGEMTPSGAIGHDPPAAVRFLPTRAALDGRGEGAWEPWPLDRKGMKALYLPPYLDSMRVMEAQVGHFRTESGVLFVGAATVDYGGFGEHLRGAQVGLYFGGAGGEGSRTAGTIDADGRVWAALAQAGGPEGVEGPLSLEVLFPDWKRAQRARFTARVPDLPPDVVTLSDVMILRDGPEPRSRDEVARVLRAGLRLAPRERVRIAFEVYGMGFRAEPVTFRVWLERTDPGFLSRAAGWLGFGDDGEALSVSWTEPGPDAPGPLFRTLEIDLPGLDEGTYDLVVGVRTPGRSEARQRRRIRVGEGEPAR